MVVYANVKMEVIVTLWKGHRSRYAICVAPGILSFSCAARESG